MAKQKIIFRADGNLKIGLGHISRCLALAELLADDYHTCFAVQEPNQKLADNLRKVVDEVIVLSNSEYSSPSFIQELIPHLKGDEIVVLDGYHFDTEYEKNVKKSVGAIVSIDDIPSRHFVADLIINFCGTLSKTDYSCEFYSQLYSGFDYVFLRSPFLRNNGLSKRFNNRLFLNMGGADSGNETLKILNDLNALNFPGEIDVVVGDNYPHLDSLNSILGKRDSITINQGLTAKEMFSCMSKCAWAIVPPSTVALEFLSTGGLVFLHQTAINQSLQKNYLIDSKLAFDYADFELIEADAESLFNQTLQLQRESLDGSSLFRVQKIFNSLSLSSQLSIRRVTQSDREQIYKWANDPEVRGYSYSKEPIPWEDHVQWFDRKLADQNCFYFIVELQSNSAGQIRFDFLKDEDAFQISYALDSNCRGKGLGYYLLIKGMQKLSSLTPMKKVIGHVQKSNAASLKAFRKAGFTMFLSKSYPDSFKFELSVPFA